VKRVPKTLENTREADVTIVKAGDEDIAIEEDQDEFAAHFNSERPPHVLLTTCYKCTSVMYKFCADLMVRPPLIQTHRSVCCGSLCLNFLCP
jgi:ribosome production factor 1